MSLGPEHGAGGLWEVYRWTSAGGVVVELNVQDDAVGARVDQLPRLNGSPDREDPRDKVPGQHGEYDYDRSLGGKTNTLSGALFGPSLEDMRLFRTSMAAAFADTRPGTMEIIPHASTGGPTGVYTARVIDYDVPEVQTSHRFDREYTLIQRLSDPRIYFPSLAVDESDSTAVEVTNTGHAEARPIITVAGVSGDVSITDGASTLVFKNAPAGDIVIDFNIDVLEGMVDGDPVELDVAASDWWNDFVDGIAGNATVTISQTGGTSIRVQFTPAVWG